MTGVLVGFLIHGQWSTVYYAVRFFRNISKEKKTQSRDHLHTRESIGSELAFPPPMIFFKSHFFSSV
jgi:hypothetical protein